MKISRLFYYYLLSKHTRLISLIALATLLFMLILTSCYSSKKVLTKSQHVEMINNNDSTEYSLVVLDPGYEFYLATQPSASFHSQEYYESWNEQYVREWNMRHRNPLQYGGFYETEINYNAREDYGLDLNYRLYYYFQFIKDKYGIRLINRGR